MRGAVPRLRRNEVACLWQLLHVVRCGIPPGDDMIFPASGKRRKGSVVSRRVCGKNCPRCTF